MSKIARTTILLMVVTLIAKVLGFGRELVLASSYGAKSFADAYVMALNIPNILCAIIGTALATTYIPIYYDVVKDRGEIEAIKFTNNVTNIVVTLCISISIIGFIFSEEIVKIFAFGFDVETLKITIMFTKVMMGGVMFLGLSYIMTSYLQVNDNFTIPGLISIPYNLIIILSIIMSVNRSPLILAYGTLLAIISQYLFQVPFAKKKRYKYSLYLNPKDEYVKKMILLLGPILIGVAVNQVNTLVDKAVASTLVEGSVSALNYAYKLNSFVMSIFIVSITSVIYPKMAKLSVDKDKTEFNDIVISSINVINLIVIPITIGAIVLSKPIVSLLFERGAFDENAVQMTSISLIFYSVGMIGFALRDVLCRVFYAIQDTKTPMINSTIAVVLNIILNIILAKPMSYAGLAFATSLSAIFSIILLFLALGKKVGDFGQYEIIRTLIKSLISATIMGIISFTAYNKIINTLGNSNLGNIAGLAGSVALGMLTYGFLVTIFKVKEIKFVINTVKSKLKK